MADSGTGDTPKTELVIIGVDLDERALRADLDTALVTDAELEEFRLATKDGGGLRFPLGAAVECNLGEDWVPGTVVAHDYLEAGWEQPAPYQVELADGTRIFAPIDEDFVIRASLRL